MLTDALKLSQKIIAAGEKQGIEHIEIFVSYNDDKQVMLNNKSISTQRARSEIGAGIRVVHKGAEGFAYTNIMTKEALKDTLTNAFSIAKLSPKIDGLGIATKKSIPALKGLYNKDLAALEADEITKDALDFIKGFTSVDDRISTVLSSITANISQAAIVNSNGLEVIRKSTSYQAGLLTVASDKHKAGGYVSENYFRRQRDIDFLAAGEDLGKRAIDGLNQEPIKAFKGSVIFEKQAMSMPITVVASLAASADWRQRGISFWKDKLGDKVADERFHLIDKPHDISGGGGVKPFDDEGTPTKQIDIVKDGVLQAFLHNIRTANKENLEPTGHATRSMGSQSAFTQKATNIFPNAPWILAGDMSDEELIEETKKGIIFNNYQGTVRYQNGIFSGVAKGAKLIENGEIVKPVTGVSISGNVFEIINNISGIGKEYHRTSFITTPLMKFEGINISAK